VEGAAENVERGGEAMNCEEVKLAAVGDIDAELLG
jgi:hypothetical protein